MMIHRLWAHQKALVSPDFTISSGLFPNRRTGLCEHYDAHAEVGSQHRRGSAKLPTRPIFEYCVQNALV